MAMVATLFFAAALSFGAWLIATMLSQNGAAIVRALRMDMPAAARPTPPVRLIRTTRAIRPRSAIAPAQWRAAA